MKKLTVLMLLCAAITTAHAGLAYGQVRSKDGLARIRINMTPAQVESLIGSPDRISSKVTAAGAELVWLYAESGFLTFGEAIRAGFANAAGNSVGHGVIAFTFAKGKLSSKEYHQ